MKKLSSISDDGGQRVSSDRGEINVGVYVFVDLTNCDDRVSSDDVKAEGNQFHT